VETERGGIWLVGCFFFFCYFQLVFVIVKPVGSHPQNGYNPPPWEEDCLECASALVFLLSAIFLCYACCVFVHIASFKPAVINKTSITHIASLADGR
jgi:hypothetical protein